MLVYRGDDMPAKKKARKASRTSKKTKPARKPAVQKTQKPAGKVTHFFDKISVAVVKLSAPLKVGDKIRIEGHGQKFQQTITSMQVDYDPIKNAKKGQEVGMKVAKPVKDGDLLYKA